MSDFMFYHPYLFSVLVFIALLVFDNAIANMTGPRR